jgi:hypothetical protein
LRLPELRLHVDAVLAELGETRALRLLESPLASVAISAELPHASQARLRFKSNKKAKSSAGLSKNRLINESQTNYFAWFYLTLTGQIKNSNRNLS